MLNVGRVSGETRKVIEGYERGERPVADYLADDVVYTIVADGQSFRGREEVLAMLGTLYHDAFSEASADVRNIAADEERHLAFLEFTFRGRHTKEIARWHRELVGIKPTGRKVELPMLNIYEIEGGKIKRARLYYDKTTLLRQLGQT